MKIKLIETIDTFNTLKPQWDNLLEVNHKHSLFQTWQWHSLWWKYFGENLKLQIIAATENGFLKGIAPFCLQDSHARVVQFIGGLDVTDYLDFIAAPQEEEFFFEALAHFFVQQRQTWDRLDLHFIPETSPSLTYLKPAFQKRGLRVETNKEEVCPFVELPSSWQVYLEGLNKKNRHEMKRKINKIMREINAHMTIVEKDNFADALSSFFTLHTLSSPEKANFMDNKHQTFFNEGAEAFSEHSLFELPLLVTGTRPIASLYCFSYHNRAYIYNSGYDPAYSRWSPGIVLIGLYIEELIKRGVQFVDFLRGSESYKYRFGAQNHQLYHITVT